MIVGNECNKKMQSTILGSTKIPHSTSQPAKYHADGRYYLAVFAILDSVRTKVITSNKFYALEYKYYLDKILLNIPKEYQRFYTNLSV